MIPPEPQSLVDLAARSGAPVGCAGNLPVELDDPQFFWFIEEGAVDLFLVERRDAVEQSAPQHLLRADAGRLLPGAASDDEDTTLSLIAKGLPGTMLRRLPVAGLAATRPADLAEQVDAWLSDVAVMLTRDVLNRPRRDALAEPRQAPLAAPGTLSARRGVVWVSGMPSGAGLSYLIDPAEYGPDAAAGTIPLTPTNWLTLLDPVPLAACSSEALAEDGQSLRPWLHSTPRRSLWSSSTGGWPSSIRRIWSEHGQPAAAAMKKAPGGACSTCMAC